MTRRNQHLEQLKRNRFLMSVRRDPSELHHSKSAEYVRSIRDATGLSQSEFAEASGVNIHTLRGYESGRTTPNFENHTKLEAMKK